jgi:hypothetical protein
MVHAVENLSSEDKALQNNLEGNINEESEEEKKEPSQSPTSPRSPTAFQDKLTSEQYLAQVMMRTMRQ